MSKRKCSWIWTGHKHNPSNMKKTDQNSVQWTNDWGKVNPQFGGNVVILWIWQQPCIGWPGTCILQNHYWSYTVFAPKLVFSCAQYQSPSSHRITLQSNTLPQVSHLSCLCCFPNTIEIRKSQITKIAMLPPETTGRLPYLTVLPLSLPVCLISRSYDL
jgi:hypothetical protein